MEEAGRGEGEGRKKVDEEGGKEVYEKETKKDENYSEEHNNREKRQNEQKEENEKEGEQLSERVRRVNKRNIRYRETDPEESDKENNKSKTFGGVKTKKFESKTSVPRRHPCLEPGCGKKFINAEHLQDHRRKMHQELKLKCSEPGCVMEYHTRTGLVHHSNRFHKKLKPHECKEDTCQRRFFTIEQGRQTSENLRFIESWQNVSE